jgi:hypothetical protein
MHDDDEFEELVRRLKEYRPTATPTQGLDPKEPDREGQEDNIRLFEIARDFVEYLTVTRLAAADERCSDIWIRSEASVALDDHIIALRRLRDGAVDPTLLPTPPRMKAGLSVKDERRRGEVLVAIPAVEESKCVLAREAEQSVAVKLGMNLKTLRSWRKNLHRRKRPRQTSV